MSDEMRQYGRLTLVLLGLITMLLVANLCITSVLLKQGKSVSTAPTRSLPCEAIPVRFVLGEPECADKLLRAMNVTNVHILSASSSSPGFKENATARLQQLMLRYANRSNETPKT